MKDERKTKKQLIEELKASRHDNAELRRQMSSHALADVRCRLAAGDERIQATIRQGCTEGLSAEALIDSLLAEVRSFCGEVTQEDDMTCVVVRVTV